MLRFRSHLKKRASLAFVIGCTTVTAAGAASYHHFAVTQGTGSGGATAFVQTTASGSALQGEVGSAANASIKIPFGLLGEYDPPGTAFGVGVIGLSATGYGLAGESGSDTQPSILAFPAGKGPGLQAVTTSQSGATAVAGEAEGSGTGISATADGTGYGLIAFSKNNLGIFAESQYLNGGEFESGTGPGGVARLGLSSGEGVAAEGFSGSYLHPGLTATAGTSGTDPFSTYNSGATNGNTSSDAMQTALITGKTFNRSTKALAGGSDLEISGDVYVYGHIYQACADFPVQNATTCHDVAVSTVSGTAVTTPSAHGDVEMYSSRQTAPSVEDFGSGRLTSGSGYVHLDPAFAATISHSSPYMVIVTANGPSESLYVTKRTTAGFEIHENHNGRSTVDFDYRIVARPIVDTSVRLAAIRPEVKHGALASAYVHETFRKRPLLSKSFASDASFARTATALTHRSTP